MSKLVISDAFVMIEESYRWPTPDGKRSIALIGCLVDVTRSNASVPHDNPNVVARSCLFSGDREQVASWNVEGGDERWVVLR
jgi:hypothetical protein